MLDLVIIQASECTVFPEYSISGCFIVLLVMSLLHLETFTVFLLFSFCSAKEGLHLFGIHVLPFGLVTISPFLVYLCPLLKSQSATTSLFICPVLQGIFNSVGTLDNFSVKSFKFTLVLFAI